MGKPIIYQMLPRLWGEGRMSSVDIPSLTYFKALGATHVWYTGMIRHATDPAFVKGNPGSPYAITDYYDVNPYLADNEDERMAEFEALISRTHESGLRVVLDFVPNHVARDYGRARVRKDLDYLGDGDDPLVHWKESNDFYYYPGQALQLPEGRCFEENPARATGNAFTPAPSANDWFDTIRLNYCPTHTGTWDRMLAILLFWAGKGVDAFRCDMVELVPIQFFAWAIRRVKDLYPDIQFIAEVYQKENYREWIEVAGFDYLYDKSGLYDTLRGIVGHQGSARGITGVWQQLGDLQPRMLNFLENHDEQRFASPYFGRDGQRTFAPLATSLLLNTAPFMLYFGEEIGERAAEAADGRTTIFNRIRIPSLQRLYAFAHTGAGLLPEEAAIQTRFRELLAKAADPLFAEGETFDLGYCNGDRLDPERQFAFLRAHEGRTALIFCNFGDEPASARLRIPDHAAIFGIRPGEVLATAAAYDAQITNYQ